ncbi:MAG: ABC transporter permease, partial [Chloroflexi bacterium]|nr:ABC transporter permease [Chloroflexota bacterium]
MMVKNQRVLRIQEVVLSYGFVIVLAVVFGFFALATPNFLTLGNLMGILHAAAPLLIIASGLALVVMMGKIDISVGSIAFLSSAIGVHLMVNLDVSPIISLLVTLATGSLLGMLNAFFIIVLRVNPLITTLSTMITFRGVALELTSSRVISLPEEVRQLGNASVGPVFVDVILALALLVVIYVLHRRTVFGRHIMAIGNEERTAQRLGVEVRRITFLSYILSGFLASVGGVLSTLQVGAITSYLGSGLEFTAIAVIVIGGVSLFGGSGSIIPGVLLGVLTLEIIR